MSNPSLAGRTFLQALDPNLPILASRAAIELDCAFRDKPTTLAAAHELASLLKNSMVPRTETQGGASKPLIDAPATLILSRAFDEGCQKKIDTLTDLVSQASAIAEKLSESSLIQDKDVLKKLRSFCVALSLAAVHYVQALRAARPTHPARR